jgi:hypothetical protein
MDATLQSGNPMENDHWGENIILLKTFGICVRTSTEFICLSLVNMVVHLSSGPLHLTFTNNRRQFSIKETSLLQKDQTSSGVHTVYNSMATGDLSPAVKQ